MTTPARDLAEQTLTAAQNTLAAVAAEAVRAEHVAELLAQTGLTYGDLGDGTHYVANDGEHLGDVRRQAEGTSPLLNWYAYPVDSSEPSGPYLTARIAATALLRRRAQAEEESPAAT
ncbi:hypothetical protein GCM10009839_86620 [Catenulispora yoronensis]|uniref:Uncharacterized protein n=1 Tax=Catenulispora yoronensis TaxID=450799 RepID=A0ABN2VGS3_9ACTN